MSKTLFAALALALVCCASSASAQFNTSRGANAPAPVAKDIAFEDSDGVVKHKRVYVAPKADSYGNAAGTQYDLAVDGAFEGQTIAVLQFYTLENFDFSLPKAALKEKGFSVYRWSGAAPPVEELKRGLEKSCQLWIISGSERHLTDAHLDVIKEYFEAGHGVYVWGDNAPYYADANAVARKLFGGGMTGNLSGGKTVPVRKGKKKVGIAPNHDLTTGLVHLFEGITIATLEPNDALEPLVYGSAGNLVTAYYDHKGRRAIFDGGFTRLYCNWDTAGTARYVKNSAAWLVNYERFGDDVVATKFRKKTK
jgi:hypothetical protein